MKRPTTAGVFISALLTLPLVAIIYLANRALALPFLPTNLMDWLIPIIPGGLITFGIDRMIDVITAFNLGRVDTTAKLAEGSMAVVLFIGVTVSVGVLYTASQKRLERIPLLGVWVGIALALPLAILSNYELTATNPFYNGPSLVARSAWIIGLFAGWGLALHWAWQQWQQPSQSPLPTPMPQEPPISTTAPAVTAQVTITSMPSSRVQAINRREFLIRLGGATATITVIGVGLGSLFYTEEKTIAVEEPFNFLNFPNSHATLIPAPGTRPEYTPLDQHYRIDINSGNPPQIDSEAWRLTVAGLVANPTAFSLADLQNGYTPLNQYVTLSCISNRIGGSLISTTGWTGVSLQDILAKVKPTPEATHLRITSADGFWEIVSLDLIREDRRVMLCYAWNDELLRVKHGFPLRIYIPDHYGMKQPKWITEIEAIPQWEEGYWVRRGWDRDAIMRTISVIDTVALDEAYEQAGQRFIPIGGIAHAGSRSISKVEVQIDDGEWTEAQLRESLSSTTWVIWRYDWPFTEGDHRFAVRAYDGKGDLQITTTNSPRPSGATGIHTYKI